jgi:sugar/nucleoside kinase (ribokinase family)
VTRVDVVGNLSWDRLVRVAQFPLPDEDRLVSDDVLLAGGAAGNVAAGLARLGVASSIRAAVGQDVRGVRLVDDLGRYGVDVAAVQITSAPTSEFLCIMDAGGRRSFFLNPEGAAFALEPWQDDGDDVALAFVGCRLALAKRVLSTRSAGMTFANIGFWSASGELADDDRQVIEALHCVFLNDEELRLLPARLREHLLDRSRLAEGQRVVITNGADSAVVLTADGRVALAPSPIPVIANTLGCGDAFMAGFLAAYLAGSADEACLALAHRCASRVGAMVQERHVDVYDGLVAA